MKKTTIERLAYTIKRARKNNQPMPIFFLGAGASATGRIPLASGIVDSILKNHSENPDVEILKDKTYSKLMDCLDTSDRDALLKGYIDKAKINVTHIYLAQLMEKGYVDYVLTTNFDNLMIRALALFNEFPPVHDMAILKDLTTTTFAEKSIIHLHGKYDGAWMLNTDEELDKVGETVPNIFNKIANKRPWVFIGYSGDDPILDHIKKLGRFDNGLYWVCYEDNNPIDKVKKFINKPNTNASIIKGYDSDSFMMRLNSELKLPQPKIIDKPFSSLKDMLENIVDIDNDEKYKDVKERLKTANNNVDISINQFEREGNISAEDSLNIEIGHLSNEIINLRLNKEYDINTINDIEERVRAFKDDKLNDSLAILYYNWGVDSSNLAELKKGEEKKDLLNISIDKYERVLEIKPDDYMALSNLGTALFKLWKLEESIDIDMFNKAINKYEKGISIAPDNYIILINWGLSLLDLANLKEGKEREVLLEKSIDKFERVMKIKSDHYESLNSWGVVLLRLSRLKEDKEGLLNESINKYEKAIEIKPDYYDALDNWGTTLLDIAELKEGKKRESLLNDSMNKFEKAIEIKPDHYDALGNWGLGLLKLAELKTGKDREGLLNDAVNKYEKAIEIKPDYHKVLHNWGVVLSKLSELKADVEKVSLLEEAIDKFERVIEIKPDYYEALLDWAISLISLSELEEETKSIKLLEEAKDRIKKAIEIKPNSYEVLFTLGLILSNQSKLEEDDDKEILLEESIVNYKKAIDVKPDFHEALYNLGVTLSILSKLKKGDEVENILKEARSKYEKATEIKYDDKNFLNSLSGSIMSLAKLKEGSEKETLLEEALNVSEGAIKHGAGHYNLSCVYALKGDKEKALKYLDITLSKKEITVEHIEKDEDWKEYREDEDFVSLLTKYKVELVS